MNKDPIAIEEIWLDSSAGEIKASALGDSLYRTYQVQLGMRIFRAEDRVSTGTIPDGSPAAFGKPIGAVTGYIERFSWAQTATEVAAPVEFSRTSFDTEKPLYVQRLK